MHQRAAPPRQYEAPRAPTSPTASRWRLGGQVRRDCPTVQPVGGRGQRLDDPGHPDRQQQGGRPGCGSAVRDAQAEERPRARPRGCRRPASGARRRTISRSSAPRASDHRCAGDDAADDAGQAVETAEHDAGRRSWPARPALGAGLARKVGVIVWWRHSPVMPRIPDDHREQVGRAERRRRRSCARSPAVRRRPAAPAAVAGSRRDQRRSAARTPTETPATPISMPPPGPGGRTACAARAPDAARSSGSSPVRSRKIRSRSLASALQLVQLDARAVRQRGRPRPGRGVPDPEQVAARPSVQRP